MGLDPDPVAIPSLFKDAHTVRLYEWGATILNACAGTVIGVKFQSAYFEEYGMHGYQSLSQLIALARSLNMVTIMDAKRGDIGSTSMAYARAYLWPVNAAGPNAFCCDYLTINPLMGEDAMMPFIDAAIEHRKGVFILLDTSNRGRDMILNETLESGKRVNEKIAAFIQGIHDGLALDEGAFGPIGCVIGATQRHASRWRSVLPNSVFLMPGIGAQGGSWETVQSCLTRGQSGVWVPISRGITGVSSMPSSRSQFESDIAANLTSIVAQANIPH